MQTKKQYSPNWGGKRENAGRDLKHGESTQFVAIRIPLSLLAKIDSLDGDTRTDKIITLIKNYFGGANNG